MEEKGNMALIFEDFMRDIKKVSLGYRIQCFILSLIMYWYTYGIFAVTFGFSPGIGLLYAVFLFIVSYKRLIKFFAEKQESVPGTSSLWLGRGDLPVFAGIVVFTLICHYFIFSQKAMYGIKGTDSTDQMIFFLPYIIKEVILKGNLWSWSYGIGGDIFSEFSYYYSTSPVLWSLAPLFRIFRDSPSFWTLENSMNIKLFLSIYKQVIIMSIMYALLRYEKRSRTASVIAAMCYAGGVYYIWNANFFDFFTDAYIWVPAMVLGFRIYRKDKNFLPLMISAALAVVNNYYFAFHTFIFFIVFVLISVIPDEKYTGFRDRMRDYIKWVSRYAAIGIGSLSLSAFAFFPVVMAFLKLDRFSNNNTVAFSHGSRFYKSLLLYLFTPYGFIGVSLILLLFVFLDYKRVGAVTKRKMILLCVFLLLYMTPYTGYVLNGMNYASERWYYLLIFVLAYATADVADYIRESRRFNVITLSGLGFCLILYGMWNRHIIEGLSPGVYYKLIFFFQFLSIGTLFLSARFTGRKKTFMNYATVLCVAAVMINNTFVHRSSNELNMNSQVIAEEEMDGPDLRDVFGHIPQSDTEFLRVVHRNTMQENIETLYGYNGMSTFSSMTDGNVHEWLKKILNVRHDIVYLSSFKNADDRYALETLLGVKYVVTKRDGYVPVPYYHKIYGNATFDLYEQTDTVGMDLWFDDQMKESDFMKLSYADRDLSLVTHAVTEDDRSVAGISSVSHVGETPLRYLFNNGSPEHWVEVSGVDIAGDTFTVHHDGSLKLVSENPDPYSQLYLHLNIVPEDARGFSVRYDGKSSFKADETNPYIYYTNDFTFVTGGGKTVTEWSADERTYKITDFYISKINISDFPEIIKKRNKYNMEDLKIGKNTVTGTVNNTEDGIMVFNIPYNKGWRLTVNGKPHEIQKMNGFLTGTKLSAGTNTLLFKFVPYGMKSGMALSFFTFTGSLYWFMKKNKKEIAVSDSEQHVV